MPTNLYLYPASEQRCLTMLRSVLRESRSVVNQFYKEQGTEYFRLRDRFPNVSKHELVKTAQYRVAHRLYSALHVKDQKRVFGEDLGIDPVEMIVKKLTVTRPSPKMEWLLDHKNFVLGLQATGMSTRKIGEAIQFRFHESVSHTTIAKFLSAHHKEQ